MYMTGGQVTLSQVLPVLQSLGVDVLDERPYTVRRPDGALCSVYDFGLRVSPVLRATAAEGVAEADLPPTWRGCAGWPARARPPCGAARPRSTGSTS